MEDVLKKFNLTNNEVKIYLCLIEIGSALAGEITSKTGIHRRNVYDSIERLIKKGLIGYVIKNNRKYFKATNPKHFFFLLEEEQQTLNKKKNKLKSIMPQLLLAQTLRKDKERTIIFEGKQGLINILEEVLKTGKENLVFSTTKIKYIHSYLKLFHRKRIKKKILDKIILNKNEEKRAKQLSKLKYTEVKMMPKEFDSPLALNIFGNKVGMLIFSENPIGILIEDREVADSFRKYFKLLWEMAEKV